MENVYQLTGKYAQLDEEFNAIAAELDEYYEATEGEVDEHSTELEGRLEELNNLRSQVLAEIVQNSDAYAEIALNKAAQRKMLEAELKQLKEEQKKAQQRYEAKINSLERSEQWWKDNFAAAMQIGGVEKIGGAKTQLLHTIWFKESTSVETDEPTLLAPYQEAIDELNASLPAWAKVTTSINKTELKKAETMPDGATLVTSKSLQIK